MEAKSGARRLRRDRRVNGKWKKKPLFLVRQFFPSE